MDIEFALSDLFENIRPKLTLFKTFVEAADAVDALLESNKDMAAELREDFTLPCFASTDYF